MLDNIKSNLIMIIIFNNVKNKRKLKILKYSKRMMNRINITKENFQEYAKLKEFNNKYETNIGDIEIKELNIYRKNIGNKGLKDLFSINFRGLSHLNLGMNELSDISGLENVNLKNLTKLVLVSNNISDINFLEKISFENLEKLNLSSNKISDINIFENVNLKNLKELYLGCNEISDIKVLKSAKFENLEKLKLGCKISNINYIRKSKF